MESELPFNVGKNYARCKCWSKQKHGMRGETWMKVKLFGWMGSRKDNGNSEEKHEESKQNRNCLNIINVSSEQSLRLANCHEFSHLRTMICIEDHQG